MNQMQFYIHVVRHDRRSGIGNRHVILWRSKVHVDAAIVQIKDRGVAVASYGFEWRRVIGRRRIWEGRAVRTSHDASRVNLETTRIRASLFLPLPSPFGSRAVWTCT
ncbi:hypothetical protein DMN91_007578 [Ooceraea biroi]|uniref:Uncharacterized protein n=1 Tax=Ooceraea biroi TaxID=2015173 RepID=A0A3L8DL89_OOCBI|nr:hypothetical protein DMN91_007578 [Ooceraea biroi]